jgi:chromate transporter
VTFVPCFLWIFLGAPYVERLRGQKALSAALSGITAVVVGVVLNVAIWFALHTVFAEVEQVFVGPLRLFVPDPATLDPVALVIAAAAFVALFRYRASMLATLAGAALAGLVYYLLAIA